MNMPHANKQDSFVAIQGSASWGRVNYMSSIKRSFPEFQETSQYDSETQEIAHTDKRYRKDCKNHTSPQALWCIQSNSNNPPARLNTSLNYSIPSLSIASEGTLGGSFYLHSGVNDAISARLEPVDCPRIQSEPPGLQLSPCSEDRYQYPALGYEGYIQRVDNMEQNEGL